MIVGKTLLIRRLTYLDTDRPHGMDPAPVELYAPTAAQQVTGGVPLPVGRPDFKSGWGRQTTSGGFDSHPPPPSTSEVQK